MTGRSEALRESAGLDFAGALAAVPAPVLALNGGRDLVNRLGEGAFVPDDLRVGSHRSPGVAYGLVLARPGRFDREVVRFLECRCG